MSLALRGVRLVHADGTPALADLDLRLEQGEQVALIGPSGAGKTSLLRLLATALRPAAGQLELLGEDPWALGNAARRLLRARIGLIHQAPPLPARQRVITAVLAGRLGQWSLARSLVSLVHPLDRVGAAAALAPLDLADRLYASCDQLSGGQLQRVGIARALYQQPQLLLADEPVSAMDPVLADHTLGVLGDAATRQGTTLVTSLHNVELALQRYPRILGLRAGRLLWDKPASAVTAADLAELYANEGLGTVLPPATPAAAEAPLDLPRC